MSALEYAFEGWPTFPLKPASKVPATAHGCKDATTDVDRIKRWSAANPAANWGLATGHAFDVLDIDDQAAAAAALGELWQAAGEPDGFLSDPSEHGPAVSTPSGGVHLYLAATGLGNRTKFIPGCDWRGVGGYVVAPPSRDHRGGWEWVDGYGPETPLPECPGWLLDALRPTTIAGVPSPQTQTARRSDSPTAATPERITAGLVRFVLESKEGTRNARYHWALCRADEHGLTATAIAAIKDAAKDIGLGHHEIEATAASAKAGSA